MLGLDFVFIPVFFVSKQHARCKITEDNFRNVSGKYTAYNLRIVNLIVTCSETYAVWRRITTLA